MVRVRGRAQPVRLYELFADDRAFAWLDEHRAAYAVMREGDTLRAAGMFSALHARTGDGVSAFHASHCTTPRGAPSTTRPGLTQADSASSGRSTRMQGR